MKEYHETIRKTFSEDLTLDELPIAISRLMSTHYAAIGRRRLEGELIVGIKVVGLCLEDEGKMLTLTLQGENYSVEEYGEFKAALGSVPRRQA